VSALLAMCKWLHFKTNCYDCCSECCSRNLSIKCADWY